MSKTTSIVICVLLGVLALAAGLPILGKRPFSEFQPLERYSVGPSCVRRADDLPVWRDIPGGTNWLGSRSGAESPRPFVTAGFRMAATEVTVGQFLVYLRSGSVEVFDSPQVERVGGEWRARVDLDLPATHVSRELAEEYTKWLGGRLGRVVRLPTEEEWEYAARAGVDGAPYPWGWEAPEGRACFAATGAVAVGRYAANRWGLRDMAGNVAERCTNGDARGGSWADRSPLPLRVFHSIVLPADYRDADLGFRPIKK